MYREGKWRTKLSRLLIDGGTTVLRSVFHGFHLPAKPGSWPQCQPPHLNKQSVQEIKLIGRGVYFFFLGQLSLLRLFSLFFLRPYCLFNRIIKFKVRLQEALVFDRALCLPDDQATSWCSSAFLWKNEYAQVDWGRNLIFFWDNSPY